MNKNCVCNSSSTTTNSSNNSSSNSYQRLQTVQLQPHQIIMGITCPTTQMFVFTNTTTSATAAAAAAPAPPTAPPATAPPAKPTTTSPTTTTTIAATIPILQIGQLQPQHEHHWSCHSTNNKFLATHTVKFTNTTTHGPTTS